MGVGSILFNSRHSASLLFESAATKVQINLPMNELWLSYLRLSLADCRELIPSSYLFNADNKPDNGQVLTRILRELFETFTYSVLKIMWLPIVDFEIEVTIYFRDIKHLS